MGSERLTLRVKECAALADVCENTILALVRQNRIPHVRIGKAIRVSRLGFLRFLEGQVTPNQSK